MRIAPVAFTPAHRVAIATVIRQTAIALAVCLPLAFLTTRAGAEIVIGILDGLFLLRSTARRRWAWLRHPWMITGLAWWGWMVVCSTPIAALGIGESGWHSWAEAVLIGRFLLLAAALSDWLLAVEGVRRAVSIAIAAAAAWIGVECWQQYLFGANWFGAHRWMDGALTGPFRHPVAGPALVLIVFPALLPAVNAMLKRGGRWLPLLAATWFALGVVTMVLIGQRMPALLTGLGLVACGIVLPRLRPVVIGAAAAAIVLLAALPLVSPPTFGKLVVKFADQMHHFPTSPYGEIYVRATVMGIDNPVTGLGFDGFRTSCNDPSYQRGLDWAGVSDAQAAGPAGCNIHPHNHYMEALTSGGFPGLLLFSVMAATWLATLGAGLLRQPAARRVGYFVAVLVAVWPFASTSAFFTLPNAGWLFLALGAGLADSHRRRLPHRAARYPAMLPAAGE